MSESAESKFFRPVTLKFGIICALTPGVWLSAVTVSIVITGALARAIVSEIAVEVSAR